MGPVRGLMWKTPMIAATLFHLKIKVMAMAIKILRPINGEAARKIPRAYPIATLRGSSDIPDSLLLIPISWLTNTFLMVFMISSVILTVLNYVS